MGNRTIYRTISYSVVLIDLCKFKNDIKCPEVRKLLWFYEEFKSLEELQEKTFKKYPLLKSYSGNHVEEYIYYINEKSKLDSTEKNLE